MGHRFRIKSTVQPHPRQQEILDRRARFTVVACGRRFGKTETGKLLLAEALRQRGGSTARAWWIAPTYGVAGQVWRELAAMFEPMNPRISAAQRRIDFDGGGFVAVKSAHTPDRLRGAGLDYAVMDEAAQLSPSLWPEVIRPMLLERKGGAAFLSTPLGHNHFWELFKLGQDPDEPEWASFQYPSTENPAVDPADMDAIRATTPNLIFRAEYNAEFVEAMGAVFRQISACLTASADAQPHPSQRVVIGIDWGRDVDYTAAAVLDADTMRLLAIDRFNGISWSQARARLAALARRWNASSVWAESNSIGQPNIEALQQDGIPVRPFNTNVRSKHALIDGLAVAIERGGISLYPDPVLLSELASYRLEPLPGGGYRYTAPSGAHDDTVIALALAYHAARQGRFSLDFA